MRQDAIAQLSATAYDINGMPLDVPFRWRSSNINVVAVDSLGNVHALAPGNALVMAWAEEGGRRRVGQVAVQVMREGMPGFPGGPPPGSMPPPGAPPGAMPGMP
ncbi:MAG: Ig domain-containing protein, partial [Gemmatimonadales bacterium]